MKRRQFVTAALAIPAVSVREKSPLCCSFYGSGTAGCTTYPDVEAWTFLDVPSELLSPEGRFIQGAVRYAVEEQA